jgi:hypothetical protein
LTFKTEAILANLSFSAAPEKEVEYLVGDYVEVLCDHENKEGDRQRGWLTGIVVQVDPKILAVQFEEKVYLTDGWMIPDHVLWSPITSPKIRAARKVKRRPRK